MLHDLNQAPVGGRVYLPRVDDATTNAVLDEFEAMRDALPRGVASVDKQTGSPIARESGAGSPCSARLRRMLPSPSGRRCCA